MAVNRDKPDSWKRDIANSVGMYNSWFKHFAPDTYRAVRDQTTRDVETALVETNNLKNIGAELLNAKPSILSVLRMSTCPPLAVDRLIGLASVSRNLVKIMERDKKLPVLMPKHELARDLTKIGKTIEKMADPDIFVWLKYKGNPSEQERYRAATIVADRLCSSIANPIIRNAQEKRQLAAIGKWLTASGYKSLTSSKISNYSEMQSGTFLLRFNMPAKHRGNGKAINIPVDVVVMPKTAKQGQLPLLIEAKSAGDFTNVNKRRKEEAAKVRQLRQTYGENIQFILFLCGYFDSGYLGYEAAEGIDWVWEHRIDDLKEFGL